ncbi:hypothetical protein LGH70_09850 [Hymenobacter sp. BT635]|uniref:Uncharacterized protein n=1 Tax=Hymenobacter nitidus TaxID=2880929 RepID=A0ABS8AF74_9BACT|nr:hypothetical protein [Hymenobacter nitidus]MCB2377885.1 hypothetical protein [Hymenobacter nitidus]
MALAFLLLLGCGVLGQQAGRLKTYHILQITVPPPVPDEEYAELMPEPYMAPVDLEAFRPWHTVTFTGNTWLDYFSLSQVQAIARKLHDTPEHDRGLRIRFTEQATYARLVQSVDFFNVVGIKKYWLDMRQEPTTLYTFTSKPRGMLPDSGRMMDCAGIVLIDYMPPVTPAPTFLQQFLAFWSALFAPGTWAPLLHPSWRNSLYLLLLLSLVSGGRLFRQWRRA